jgi:hypothetical protein
MPCTQEIAGRLGLPSGWKREMELGGELGKSPMINPPVGGLGADRRKQRRSKLETTLVSLVKRDGPKDLEHSLSHSFFDGDHAAITGERGGAGQGGGVGQGGAGQAIDQGGRPRRPRRRRPSSGAGLRGGGSGDRGQS